MSLLVDADVDRNMVLPFYRGQPLLCRQPKLSVPSFQFFLHIYIYIWEGISCQKHMHWKDLECIFPSEFGVFTEDVEHGRRAIVRN